jgi:hypothetical protein
MFVVRYLHTATPTFLELKDNIYSLTTLNAAIFWTKEDAREAIFKYVYDRCWPSNDFVVNEIKLEDVFSPFKNGG